MNPKLVIRERIKAVLQRRYQNKEVTIGMLCAVTGLSDSACRRTLEGTRDMELWELVEIVSDRGLGDDFRGELLAAAFGDSGFTFSQSDIEGKPSVKSALTFSIAASSEAAQLTHFVNSAMADGSLSNDEIAGCLERSAMVGAQLDVLDHALASGMRAS